MAASMMWMLDAGQQVPPPIHPPPLLASRAAPHRASLVVLVAQTSKSLSLNLSIAVLMRVLLVVLVTVSVTVGWSRVVRRGRGAPL